MFTHNNSYSLFALSFTVFTSFILSGMVHAESMQVLDAKLHHLRIEGDREWSDFPETPESDSLILKFEAEENPVPWVIQLHQQDVKMQWTVHLNEKQLGRLTNGEQDMLSFFVVPANTLIAGENVLRIKQTISKRSMPDDIRVGEILLHKASLENVLNESSIEVNVTDADTNQPTPCRITIVRSDGAMPVIGTASNNHLAIRAGAVYTSTGNAKVSLPAGEYTIYAGRGFEYSVAQTSLKLQSGKTSSTNLSIRREVPTAGYVSCDTHIHTFTYSKHGDCEITERMITLAGEGIEFPIATDHNLHIDYEPFARKANVLKYFTPVIGNEVTTKLGHFNIFPVVKDSPLPNHNTTSWDETIQEIKNVPNVRVIILNHARDIHSGTRPFGSLLQNEAVGENLEGWKLQANAMEVINSGATQTDHLQLLRDWMTQLNRGRFLTPVGCSDSHDVNRYIVGQGRTYIRTDDKAVGNIDREATIQNFIDGRVLVSFGLITEMKINDKYQSGDLVKVSGKEKEVTVDLRVLGPHWVDASHIQLFANGQLIREKDIQRQDSNPQGVIWSDRWKIKVPKHDVHLVAIATGPGIEEEFWRTAKPYQPTSAHFESKIIGASGAIWIDADRNQQKTSAYEYASNIYSKSEGDINKLIALLKDYDAATAAQAAHLYQEAGHSILSVPCQTALKAATPATKQGFRTYFEAWRKTVLARNGK